MRTHLKKCEICGMNFEESSDPDYLILMGPAKCPYCKKIIEFEDFLKDYSNSHSKNVINNEIYKRNYRPIDFRKTNPFFCTSVYSQGDCIIDYKVEGRTEDIENIIERIQSARTFMTTRIGPQFEIMDSIYEKKNKFWNYAGNFISFVHDASLQYIIIKLSELIDSSKYSVKKIANLIEKNKKRIFEVQKVYEVYNYQISGDVQEQLFPKFPILDCLEKLRDVLEEYKDTITAIKTLRDKEFAHLDGENVDEFYKKINYVGLKRIFNSLKIIYIGLLYSVAPEKITTMVMHSNIMLDSLDDAIDRADSKKQ